MHDASIKFTKLPVYHSNFFWEVGGVGEIFVIDVRLLNAEFEVIYER